MAASAVKTISSGTLTLEEGTVAELGASLRGELIEPCDAAYDEARTLYNAMIDKHPALIARCRDVADVMAAVNFARDNDILLAVRGAVHEVVADATAWSYRDATWSTSRRSAIRQTCSE